MLGVSSFCRRSSFSLCVLNAKTGSFLERPGTCAAVHLLERNAWFPESAAVVVDFYLFCVHCSFGREKSFYFNEVLSAENIVSQTFSVVKRRAKLNFFVRCFDGTTN